MTIVSYVCLNTLGAAQHKNVLKVNAHGPYDLYHFIFLE